MQLKRRNVLFGLLGLGLPLIASSCARGVSSTSASSSSGSAIAEKIRIGYQVYAGSELLAKGLGLAKQIFPNVQVEYLRFDAGRDVNTALAAKGIDFGVLGSTAAPWWRQGGRTWSQAPGRCSRRRARTQPASR